MTTRLVTKKPFWYLAMGLIGLVAIGLWQRPPEPAVADDGPQLLGAIRWSEPTLLSDTSPNGAFEPVIEADGNGHLMAMYNHVTGNGVENPYFRQSTNGGESWTAAAPVYNSAVNATQVDFVFDHNNVAHAVFRETQNFRILYAREDQWPNSAKTVTNPGELTFSPAIAVGPNNFLHVVWSQQDNRIYHSFSQNGGNNWSSPAAISSSSNKSDVAAIAVDSNNNVHVVWEERIFIDPGPPVQWHYEIHYKKGTLVAGNVNWQANPTVISGAAYDAHRPAIVADGLRLHVGFARQEANRDQLAYYTRFSNGSWSTPIDTTGGQPITVNTASPFFLIANLTICNQNVYLYYHGAVALNAAEQVLGGTNADGWNARDEVTDGDNRDINPAVTCAGGKLHLVFARVLVAEESASIHQIYYVSSQPGGVYLPAIFRGS